MESAVLVGDIVHELKWIADGNYHSTHMVLTHW